MYAAALKDYLDLSIGCGGGVGCGVKYFERFVVAIYAAGPLGILVAYFVLRVEVSLDRVVMTLLPNTSFTNSAAESVAASAFGSK